MRTYHDERRRFSCQQSAKRIASEKRLQDVRPEIQRIVDGVARGDLAPAVFGPEAASLDEERKALEANLREEPKNLIALLPAALARYETMVGQLQQSVAAGIASGNSEYAEAIRELVETVMVRPGPAPGRIEIQIVGHLDSLLAKGGYLRGGKDVSGLMVAGARFSQSRHSLQYGLRAAG